MPHEVEAKKGGRAVADFGGGTYATGVVLAYEPGKRIVYGGHIISLTHAISYDGLENALRVLAFNSGTHANPTVAGDTLYAFTDVIERVDLGRDDLGALRLRLVGVKNQDPGREHFEIEIPDPKSGRKRYHSNLVLDLDYTVLIPRRPQISASS